MSVDTQQTGDWIFARCFEDLNNKNQFLLGYGYNEQSGNVRSFGSW